MALQLNQAAVNALFAAVVDTARATNAFARVNGHEPKSAPGVQVSCSLWLAEYHPATRSSSLNAVSGVVTFSGRVYKSDKGANALELDAIDPAVLTATLTLLAAYSGGFTLGETVRAVDLLGMEGTAMGARAAYAEQDGKQYRVMEISVPVIVNDLYTEAP